ncbi:hypothetical protein [Verrucosispora sioxanthis]|uniref:Uncharacterized protein n=1 Tax=Verrucosispora sioxanthis TaxID=2499994 RepID=A0A6M1KW86_9ACTN|nr:hypothetical protein [Verrucosispora sioxanthis]NEE62552.1 hypothetical protein [Verrucosispora sioxanthis]NGM11662.1 hypothetical protein [Verrucosispora sioxanthis]
MSGEQGMGSVEMADLPEIEVDSKPDLLVLVAENDVPIGWAIVLPEGDFWLIRKSTRSLAHGSSLATLTTFWATVLRCDVGRPRLAEPPSAGVRD